MTEHNSYTTHVKITKDSGLPLASETLLITSPTDHCHVYINNVSHVLKADLPTEIEIDYTGVVTIVQDVQNLTAACYYLELKSSGEKCHVNPMCKILDTMSSVKSGDDLGSIQIPDGKGGSTSLISSSVPSEQRDTAAKALQHFMDMAKEMPADGSPQTNYNQTKQDTWGVSFDDGKCSYLRGDNLPKFLQKSNTHLKPIALFGTHIKSPGFIPSLIPYDHSERKSDTMIDPDILSDLMSRMGPGPFLGTGEQEGKADQKNDSNRPASKTDKKTDSSTPASEADKNTDSSIGTSETQDPSMIADVISIIGPGPIGIPFSNVPSASTPPQEQSTWDWVTTMAGDAWNWFKTEIEEVKNFVVQIIDGIYHFIVEIGELVLEFIMSCLNDVINAVQVIFSKIKVFFEDFVKWLGFLFDWDDILRSHDVLKNILRQYLKHAVGQIDTYKSVVSDTFQMLEDEIDKWADIEPTEVTQQSISDIGTSVSKQAGMDSPEANWGVYHLTSNATAASSMNQSVPPDTSSKLEKMLSSIEDAIKNEEGTFEKASDTIRDQIIGKIDSMSFGELIKKIAALIGVFVFDSLKNVVELSLDVMAILLEGVVDILDEVIEIPIISWMYSKITSGSQLSILDAICLVLAIPATIGFKIIEDTTPFPDTSATNALISAKNWKELQDIFQNSTDTTPSLLMSGAAATALPGTAIKALRRFLNLASPFGSSLLIQFSVLKRAFPTVSKISIIHGVSFFAATFPAIGAALTVSHNQTAPVILGEIFYFLSALQKLADIFTYTRTPGMVAWENLSNKIVDCFLGVAGCLVVLVFATINFKHLDISHILSMIGAACLSFNRVLTPAVPLQPEIFPAKMILIGTFGFTQFILATLP